MKGIKKAQKILWMLVAIIMAFTIGVMAACAPSESDTGGPGDTDDTGGGNITANATLVGIEVTSLPMTTEYYTNSRFSTYGLEITASYEDGTQAVVTDYEVSSPDMSTAGEKTITVTYTENGVTQTATFTITVNENSIVSIEIANSWSLQVGMDLSSLEPTVSGTYMSGVVQQISSSAYTVNVTDGDGNAATGFAQYSEQYTVTVVLNDNPTVSDSKTYNMGEGQQRYEAEDAVASGVSQAQAGSHGYFNRGVAFTSDGSTYYPGTLTFTVYALEGTYDLVINAGSMYALNTAATDSADYGLHNVAYYDQLPNYVGDTVDLAINGVDTAIEETAVFYNTTSTNSLATSLNNFQLITLCNVSLENGANTITFTFHESDSGITNRWNNPPSINIDYLEIVEAQPSQKTITGISVYSQPWIREYAPQEQFDSRGLLIQVTYNDGSTGYICSNYTVDGFDSSVSGDQTLTVTYSRFTATFTVTVLDQPVSVEIQPFDLYYGADPASLDLTVVATYAGGITRELSSEEYTVTVLDSDGAAVSSGGIQLGEVYSVRVTYVVGETTLTDEISCNVKVRIEAEDSQLSGHKAIHDTSVEFDIANSDNTGTVTMTTPDMPAGTYNLQLAMLNGYLLVQSGSSYYAVDLSLAGVMEISVNGQNIDLSGITVRGVGNTGGSSSSWRLDAYIQTVDLGEVEFSGGVNTIVITVKYDSNQLNRWSAILLAVDALIISPVTAG